MSSLDVRSRTTADMRPVDPEQDGQPMAERDELREVRQSSDKRVSQEPSPVAAAR